MSKNTEQEFLKKLKLEAKIIQSLQKEKLIPDQVSAVVNFIATHSWQIILFLALFTSLLWELLIYQGKNG